MPVVGLPRAWGGDAGAILAADEAGGVGGGVGGAVRVGGAAPLAGGGRAGHVWGADLHWRKARYSYATSTLLTQQHPVPGLKAADERGALLAGVLVSLAQPEHEARPAGDVDGAEAGHGPVLAAALVVVEDEAAGGAAAGAPDGAAGVARQVAEVGRAGAIGIA